MVNDVVKTEVVQIDSYGIWQTRVVVVADIVGDFGTVSIATGVGGGVCTPQVIRLQTHIVDFVVENSSLSEIRKQKDASPGSIIHRIPADENTVGTSGRTRSPVNWCRVIRCVIDVVDHIIENAVTLIKYHDAAARAPGDRRVTKDVVRSFEYDS